MNIGTFTAIETILRENGLTIPKGRGDEKLDVIQELIDKGEMSEDVRNRIQNLLVLR